MDAIKAEIAARKKRKLASEQQEEESGTSKQQVSNDTRQKYVRRGESIEERRADSPLKSEKSSSSKEESDSTGKEHQNIPNETTDTPKVPEEKEERFNISTEEAIRRLRQKGEPIRLFGESDKERRLRLRSLELIEQRGEKMGQNDFMKALRGAESSAISNDLLNNAKSSLKSTSEEVKEGSSTNKEEDDGQREGVGMNSVLDLNLIKKDINKVYPIIYYTLKGLMRDWETSLAERPIEIRQSSQGKLVAATQVQTADYMKPLLKQLRHRSVKPDVLARLAEIIHYVQKREYRNANDSYLQLSIGNAPWPIGVTMVGIHERSGREKIFSSNVAHVLNDEVSRKYIQSLKRLMTFAQTRYPPKDVSMLMG
ncbi:hypothetical protein L7F22_009257 [Adiantum nelumboides]|nr:hypothetical protein [Adiantum nelumboides]